MKKEALYALLMATTLLVGCTESQESPLSQEETPVTTVETKNTETVSEPSEEEASSETTVEPTSTGKPSYYVAAPVGQTFPATITKVSDGDTVKIKLSNGKEESVRLLLIDTPETVHPSKPVQPFGPEASAFAKEFFKVGDTVNVDIDVSERDKYGRLLAYLWKDGILYQDAIIEAGLARVAYVYAPNTAYVDSLRENQSIAQKKGIGIWSIENYASEQGFDDGAESQAPVAPVKEAPAASGGTISDANGDGLCNDVKGNEGSGGNIYHVPGGSFYEKTKPEQTFCTEQEAVDAGFRKSQR